MNEDTGWKVLISWGEIISSVERRAGKPSARRER